MADPKTEKLSAFVQWSQDHITGDEKGQAQIFLDRLYQAFAHPGSFDVGGDPEFRVRKASDGGGGTAFADYVWKPVVLIELKKRGTVLSKGISRANSARSIAPSNSPAPIRTKTPKPRWMPPCSPPTASPPRPTSSPNSSTSTNKSPLASTMKNPSPRQVCCYRRRNLRRILLRIASTYQQSEQL